MTGDDLKRMQEHFLEGAKNKLRERGRLRPIGFVVTLHKHVERLLASGWGLEILDPKTACIRDAGDDQVSTLVLDLLMDWKRLYHATLTVFPQVRDILGPMIALAEMSRVDDPYKRTIRPFLAHMQLHEKDIIAALMRHVCDKVDAFASIMQTEAWLRAVELTEDVAKIPNCLSDDTKSVEVILSSMETYDFARMITLPIHRKVSKASKKRDQGKVVGFGEVSEGLDTPDNANKLEGRFMRFLKPLGVAS